MEAKQPKQPVLIKYDDLNSTTQSSEEESPL